MKVDAYVLNKAIDQVPVTRYAAELREAVIYGPPILSELYSAYLKEMQRQEERQARHVRVAQIVAITGALAMVLTGLWSVLS